MYSRILRSLASRSDLPPEIVSGAKLGTTAGFAFGVMSSSREYIKQYYRKINHELPYNKYKPVEEAGAVIESAVSGAIVGGLFAAGYGIVKRHPATVVAAAAGAAIEYLLANEPPAPHRRRKDF